MKKSEFIKQTNIAFICFVLWEFGMAMEILVIEDTFLYGKEMARDTVTFTLY